MEEFRKFLDVEYGEPDPEVKIAAPQRIDMEHPGKWRTRVNEETVQTIKEEMSKCGCYPDLMGVKTEERIVYRDGTGIPLRLYYPSGAGSRNYSVVLFCHGGSFSMNSIDVYDMVHRYLACYGKMIIAAANYRMAPEHPFPCGIEDCYAALKWVSEHAEEIGGNADNISVCGDSSGGNFAAVLCLMARDRGGPVIRKQALIYPVTTLTEREPTESELWYKKGYFLEYEDIRRLSEGYVPEGVELSAPYLSPLCEDNLRGLPEAGFFSAQCDPLLDQGLMYAARLSDAGVKVEYHVYEGMIHAFLNAAYKKTFEMIEDVCCFLGTGYF